MSKRILFARITAAILFSTGLSVLVGWFVKATLLIRLSPSLSPMMPNTAIGFLLFGLVMILLTFKKSRRSRNIIILASSVVVLLGLLTLSEYVFVINLGIDQLFFPDVENPNFYPGRMSMLTALNFIIIGLCFIWDAMNWSDQKFMRQYAMLLVLFIALFSLSGIIFGAVHFISHITAMALHSAIGFLLLSTAYLALHSKVGWVSTFFANNLAGVLMRNTLIPIALLYPCVAFLRMLGEKSGFYNTEGGTVFMMISSLALFTTIILTTAQTINRLDLEKDQYKKFFELSSEMLVIADPDGFIKLASGSFMKVLGYTESETLNNPMISFIYPNDVSIMKTELERLSKGTPLTSFQVRLKTKNGAIRHFLWSCTPDTKTGDLYAAGYDITEIKEAQQVRALAERLSQQNKQLASFAHIVSHNLRSPVGNLKALLQLHHLSAADEKDSLFEKFELVAEHLSTTLNDLIDSLRIKEEVGKSREHLYFENVLTKTREILTGQILESGAIITSNFSNASSIEYPHIYLESIFLNLLSNAIKYRSANRQLRIHFETQFIDNCLSLRVEDNGQGIDLARHGENLFGFYKSFHNQKDSKGVGLFLTKTQVESMGGTIAAQSEVNKGTTFTIVFNKTNLAIH